MKDKKVKSKKVDFKTLKGRSFTTAVGRLSFPRLAKAEQYKGKGEAYYSTSILFPKDSDMKAMRKEILLAAAEAYGKDKTKWPKIRMPWRDGDKQEDLSGYEDHMYLTAKSKRKIKIVDGKKEPVEADDQDEVYGGRYARLALRAKLTTDGDRIFVSCYLQAVQLTKVDGEKGDSFGGSIDIDSAFESDEDDSDDSDELEYDEDEENDDDSDDSDDDDD